MPTKSLSTVCRYKKKFNSNCILSRKLQQLESIGKKHSASLQSTNYTYTDSYWKFKYSENIVISCLTVVCFDVWTGEVPWDSGFSNIDK